ncbi:MAG TPA: PA14 domain-containing protein, partial [bacterium]|nr:PA14 domain-containing protein [bacterium]
ILLLAAMAGLNTQTYFGDQARNQACQEAFAPAASFIGRNIEVSWKDFPGLNRYFITPSLFHHHTVDFLAYTARPNLYPFNLRDWVSGKIPRDKAIHLYLEPEQSGELEFVRALCPDSALVSYPSIFGSPEMGYCWIPKEEKHSSKPWEGGLKGVYISSSAWNAKPLAVQRDPVLNFTSKFDFPFTQPPPFRIRWRGSLEIPKSGDYQFQVITTDETQLWLDGKPVSWAKPLRLSPGAHALRLDFEKDSGDTLALNLIWKKPGEDKWQVVPATAFGKIKPNAEF